MMTAPRIPPDKSGTLPAVESDRRVRQAVAGRDRLRIERDRAEQAWGRAEARARELGRKARDRSEKVMEAIAVAAFERDRAAAAFQASAREHDEAIVATGKVRRQVEAEVLEIAGEAYDRLLDALAADLASLASAWAERVESLEAETRQALGTTSSWRRFPLPAQHPRTGSPFVRLARWARDRVEETR